jgi:hypothetical protein
MRPKRKQGERRTTMKSYLTTCATVLCLVLVVGLTPGCKRKTASTSTTEETGPKKSIPFTKTYPPKKGGVARTIDLAKVKNDLRQIVLSYLNYMDSTGRPPAKADDLAPYLDNNQRLIKLIKDGDIVVGWRSTFGQMTEGTSNTILVYEKESDGQGMRVVAMADGEVKTLNEDDFAKAVKAKGK